MSDIYQKIWEGDRHQFSVSPRNEAGEWENQNADILLDEQVKSSGNRHLDLATRPLFYKVNEEKFQLPNYRCFIGLLDNYVVNARESEEMSEEEEEEINQFLDAILDTEPMAIALNYIRDELKTQISLGEFRATLFRLWFQLYTNYYGGKSTHYASGFEHVFVGEGKYNLRFGGEENVGKISGYHSWIKFYLDEKSQRVNFLGYKYDLKGEDGPKSPNVVTLQMEWLHRDIYGDPIATLFKKKGGFFVGPSPECEIAIATVMFYESLSGKLRRDRRRATINNATYDLVLFRNTNPNGSRGDFIRSFFPIFLGSVIPSNRLETPKENRTQIVPISNNITLKNDGAIAIVAALPNPSGSDEGREWVELKNVTNAPIDLAGWEMGDRLGRPESLSGIIEPQQVIRFTVTRSSHHSMQLTNKPGKISVWDRESNQVAAVKYSKPRSGQIIAFE